ncbi:MAG TPA: ABC transporter permease [Coriobacteriia bacterium]
MSVYITAIADAFRLIFGGSSDVWPIIWLSLSVSGLAVGLAMLVGIPIGYGLGMSRFAGRAVLMVMVNTAMGFPPVVVGLFVYMAFSRTGPLGLFGLLFTPTAMVIAQFILAAPLVAGVTTAAIASVPRDLRFQVRALGASRWQERFAVLKEARRGVMASVIAGFGGVISEVGAVSIVGGNIEGSTRVMTTAIMFNVRRGEFGLAMAWAMVLIGIALIVNAILTSQQNIGASYER